MVKRQMGRGLGGVRDRVHNARFGPDREHEARAKGVRRAQEIAEIDGLRDALDADGEIAAGSCRLGFHGSFMP